MLPPARRKKILLNKAPDLYGSDLEQRVEYERVDIPVIVTRCIQEVELRGEFKFTF